MRPDGDTAPIRAEERFNEPIVADYLRRALPELFGPEPISFAQFPGGKANLTYLAVSGDREYVLRRPPLGEVAPGSHDMEREYRVLSRLWDAFPLAPRALHFCADPAVMGKPFLVMERRHGWVVREAWPPGFGEAERQLATTSLVDGLVGLHAVDPAAVGLGGLGRPEGFVERQVVGWTDRWERARTRPVPAMDEVAERLVTAIPPPQTAAVLHNDYKLDNTMVDDRGRVTAVFDWDMATIGDPLVDVGTMLAYWSAADNAAKPIIGSAGEGVESPLSAADAARHYGTGSGLDLSRLDYYLALAYFRIGVIVEQIYARYRSGQTTDARFAGMGDMVPELAAAAQRALE